MLVSNSYFLIYQIYISMRKKKILKALQKLTANETNEIYNVKICKIVNKAIDASIMAYMETRCHDCICDLMTVH